MRYRENRRTGDRISEIGMGTAYITETNRAEAVRTVRHAFEGGINYFDLAAADGSAFSIFGDALSDVREKVLYQIHFGADYTRTTYGWTLDLDTVKRSVDRQLRDLRTDYIDYGFIHCQDESSDWLKYRKNGILDYLLELKESGVVKHVGASSHTPSVIREILAADLIDMLMFSVNPAYDYNHGEYAYGGVDERSEIYRLCESMGVGISVMKPFSGGQLLSDRLSPFGKALTPYQCIKYALDRPGVLTVLPGAKSKEDIDVLLKYYEQSAEDLDYGIIGSFAPRDAAGKCVYCNHCAPCPAGIDVGMVNKFYDLAQMGDHMAVEHYLSLKKNASDCTGCGHCNKRCPFTVDQKDRMREINEYFEAKKENVRHVTWRQKWQSAYQKASFYQSEKNSRVYWDGMARIDGGSLAGDEHIRSLCNYLCEEKLLAAESSVLDIGCGGGEYVAAFANACCRVTALDYAPDMIDRCKALCESKGMKNVSYVLMDFMEDRVMEKHDIVLSCLNPSTYHPAAFDKMLSLASRVLVYFSMDSNIDKSETEPIYCGCNSVRYAEEYLKELRIPYKKIPYEYSLKMSNGETRKIAFAYLVIATS